MTSISRSGSSPSLRFSVENSFAARFQAPAQPTSAASQKPQPPQNLFGADSFDKGAKGAGGSQDMIQKLQELVKVMSQLSELLGGENSAKAGGAQGGGTPLDAAPEAEQVPDLGEASAAGGGSPQMNQPPVPLENRSQAGQSSEGSPATGGVSGKSDAKDFMAQSASSQGPAYKEIAHEAPGLGEKNKGLWDAAHKAGATDEEAAIMVAQQMQEGGNDASKSGSAENFGPLNLNRDLLKNFGGVQEGELSKLNGNSPDALEANAKASLTAMRSMGTERYLDHVRNGSTGYENPSDDTKRFGNSIANAANHVLEDYKKDPSSISRDWRQAAEIGHI